MILRAILICLITLIFSNNALAIQATSTHTVFYKKNKNDSNHLEANILINWRVQNSTLHFHKNDAGNLEAKFICTIRISNEEGVFKEESFKVVTPAKTTPAEAFDQVIADQYEYKLATGNYVLQIALYEPEYKDQIYEYRDTLTIKEQGKKEIFLSGIQLLDTFFANNSSSIYARNGFLDLSLNSNYLDENKNDLLFYYELYNANSMPENLRPVKINTYISWKPFGAPVPGMEKKDSVVQKTAQQTFHSFFPLEELQSGNYYLNVVLSDKSDIVIDKKSLFIQRYNMRPKPQAKPPVLKDSVEKIKDTGDLHVLDLTATFVGKYTPSQVRAILKMLLLTCDANEALAINGFLNKPDELYGKYFIYNYWEKRDKQNPERAWKAYAERIKEVNKLFGGGTQAGYESDRGRIYIQYGKPSDRIIVNNETGSLPYEIWQYYTTEKQQREGVFLFYKSAKSFSGYDLLHSTVVGEVRNPNWRTMLYSNSIVGNGMSNQNSQAEQYIGNK